MNTQNNKENENKNQTNTSRDEQADWKAKFNYLVNTCQSELKKTTKIGMKMFSASQSTTKLHETYELIGKMVKDLHDEGKIEIKDEKVLELMEITNELHKELDSYEQDVQEIKKSN